MQTQPTSNASADAGTQPAPPFQLIEKYQEHIKFLGRAPRTLAELAVATAEYEHRQRLAEIKALTKKLALLDALLPALAARGVRLNYHHFTGRDRGKVLRIGSVFSDDAQLLRVLIELGFRECERKPWGNYETVTLKHGRALLVQIDIKKAVVSVTEAVPA